MLSTSTDVNVRSADEVAAAVAELRPFARAGYVLFPLAVRAKVPRERGWQGRDYRRFNFRRWLEVGGNAGFRLGPTDIVFDLDPRNIRPGDDPLRRLSDAVGVDLRDAPAVVSGAGGRHFFWKLPTDVRAAKPKGYDGIDLKRFGGFVVAPGSLHPDGGTYRTDQTAPPISDVATIPAALVELLRRPINPERRAGAGALEPEQVALLLTALDPCDFGQGRYDAWITLCAACHDATAGDGLAIFQEWCARDDAYASAEAQEAVERHWLSFEYGRAGGATYRTLFRLVINAGRGDLVRAVSEDASLRGQQTDAIAAFAEDDDE